MLACKKSHTSSSENVPVIIYDSNNSVQPIGITSDYWEFVLSGISTQDGKFKVGFSDTVENLPNATEHVGEIFVVGPINNSYVEYIAIHSPSYDNQYIWEKVGSDSISVDAYTKKESDEKYQVKGNYLTSIPDEYATKTDVFNSASGIASSVSTLSRVVEGKQDTLIDGQTIKTINGQSILGEGNIELAGNVDLSNYYTKEEINDKKYITEIPEEYITNDELVSKGYTTTGELDARFTTLETSIASTYVTTETLESVVEEKIADISVNKIDGGEVSFVNE